MAAVERANKTQLLQKFRDSPNFRVLAWCAGLAVVWRFCLELINQSIVPYIAPPSYSSTRNLPAPAFHAGLHRWLNWDSGWYNDIATHGYYISHALKGPETVAFFPLFPIGLRVISHVLHVNPSKIGLVINFALTILAAFTIYKLTLLLSEKYTGKPSETAAKLSVLLLLLTPASYFFAALYAEPLLALLITASIYFALRGKIYTAALLAGLATATKSTAAILSIVLVLIYLGSERSLQAYVSKIWHNFFKLVLIGLLSLSGLFAYMAYLFFAYRRPLAFLEVEKYWDNRDTFPNPYLNVWRNEYKMANSLYHFGNNINYFMHLYLMAIPLLAIAIIIVLLRSKIQEKYWLSIMIAFVVISGVSTGSLLSLNRYILVITPLISFAAIYFSGKQGARRIAGGYLLMVSATLLFIFTAAFLGTYFVG
jgi:Gpi18-like mannosyltransferase